jgi:hypothetical protein
MDKLEAIREELRYVRDLRLKVLDLQSQIVESNKLIYEKERVTIPDMFLDAGVDTIGLPAQGNLPSYDAKLEPYYKANILASWDDDRKQEAFNWLIKHGAGDIIKSTITIRLPLGSDKLRKRIMDALSKFRGIAITHDMSVPWNTLTAYVRECFTKGQKLPPLDVLGADVGSIVKMTERKSEPMKEVIDG